MSFVFDSFLYGPLEPPGRTSNEFSWVGNAAGRSDFSRTGACGVTSSPVAGKGDDVSVSFSACANIGANNFIGSSNFSSLQCDMGILRIATLALGAAPERRRLRS